MATYQYGVVETGISNGLIQSINYTADQELAEARDASGDVKYVSGYNETINCTAEVVYDTETSLPGIGTTVHISAGKYTGYYRTTAVTITESNTDFCRANLTLKQFVANTLPVS